MTDLFRHDYESRPALLDLFRPPDGFVGDVCLITGFCADAAFLEEAMLQFTGDLASTRACNAILHGLVFLDPRQEPDLTVQVPGLIRVPPMESEWQGRKGLLHAKLLWLRFRHPQRDEQRVRVVISTGNWTRSGSEKLIDLIWIVDWNPVFKQGQPEILQETADCFAAATFLRKVAALFCVNTLTTYRELFERALDGARLPYKIKLPPSRVMDSFTVPLCTQMAERLKSRSFNFSLAGSGFFEQPFTAVDGTVAKPAVLAWLEAMTTSKSPWKNVLIVNPLAAGAVAVWRDGAGEHTQRWSVHAGSTKLPNENRSLHAKFILLSSVSNRQPLLKGAVYSSSVLYLGSGNLSKQGFLHAWINGGGNIELGVLLNLPEDLSSADIARQLPIGAVLDPLTRLASATDEYEPEMIPPVSPIVALRGDADGRWHVEWSTEPQPCKIRIADQEYMVGAGNVSVYDANLPSAPTAAAWAGTEHDGRWIGIPVIDHLGAVCRHPFSRMHFDDLLLNLSFWRTIVADEGEQGDETEEEDGGGAAKRQAGDASGDRDRFPVSPASLLIEQIAQVNDTLKFHELQAWMRRLEALLTEAAEPELLTAWQRLDMDFLACLNEPPFRPACLEDAEGDEQRIWQQAYANLIGRIRSKWKLTNEEDTK